MNHRRNELRKKVTRGALGAQERETKKTCLGEGMRVGTSELHRESHTGPLS